MRILIVTQAVEADSSTLGFFVEWLREFSRQCEEVFVIGLAVGRHDLPPNVHVMSMGKERGAGKLARLFAFWKHLRAALPKVGARKKTQAAHTKWKVSRTATARRNANAGPDEGSGAARPERPVRSR